MVKVFINFFHLLSIFIKYYNNINILYLPYKQELRNSLVKKIKNRELSNSELNLFNKVPAKLQKNALSDSIINMKFNQSNIKNKIRIKANNNKNFNKEDIRYISYVLKTNNILHKINKVNLNIKINKYNVDFKKLNSYLFKHLKKEKKKPFSKSKSYTIDSSSQMLYKNINNELFIFISTLIKKKRVSIVLSNNIKYSGNVRIVLKDNNKIELHKIITIN